MFDTVRIRSTALTERLGLAGLVGTMNGQTTPSIFPPGNIEAIGELTTDYAIRVDFEEGVPERAGPSREYAAVREEGGGWFAPELVEVIGNNPAMAAKFDAIIQEHTPGAKPGFKKPDRSKEG